MALQPTNVKTYGLLLGLAAATSVLVGYYFDPAHGGWVALQKPRDSAEESSAMRSRAT